ncbi:MAG: MFS transporter [Acidimicrobiia bacterium]|nr:MFS transporter [Acidimicrobiia bacterium]
MTATVKDKVRLGADYWRLWTASVVSNLGDGISAIAFPWIASAVTRNGFLIALIAVAQRLPWLVFTLPAGVITDRLDRRKIMVSMDLVRAVAIAVVAVVVLGAQGDLPDPDALASGLDVGTNMPVYLVLLVSALALGFAEVLRDNAAQTFLPAIVETKHLEKANGNLWGAEMVMNSFAGPPLGSVLLGIAFALPFFVDAGTFAVAAGLVFLISGNFRARGSEDAPKKVAWRAEMREGFDWLWNHPLLRPLAITLGFLNGLGMMMFSTFVLFAQEDLDLGTGLFSGILQPVADTFGFESVAALTFAILMMAGALGGVVGSVFAARISKAIGSGPSLWLTMGVSIVTSLVTGLATRWWVAFLMLATSTVTAILWNVITVSLRQTIIPDALLGRVNSVYRFFGWGMMPIGSAVGGVVVVVAERFTSRGIALRWPFFVVSAGYVLLFLYAAPKLTTEAIDGARESAIAAHADDPDTARDALGEAGVGGVPPTDD